MEVGKILSRAHELPKIPKVVRELMEMVNRDDVEMSELSRTISLEQVVSARVIRLANSAHFGRGRSVSSVDDAVIRLGLEPLRTLIVASALVSAFPYVEVIDLGKFWEKTFEIALLSKGLAQSCKINPNDAFTAGMLHNIGDLMIYTIMPDKVAEIDEKIEQGMQKPDAQKAVIGVDSAELGAKLAEGWKFSPELVHAISEQYHPKVDNIFSPLAATIRLANAIDEQWDDLPNEDAKPVWIAEQLESTILSLDDRAILFVDEIRGSGKEMAQLVI